MVFFLFPRVKQQLKGKSFQGVEDARAFVEGVISDMPRSTWSGAMVTWLERITNCVHAKGDYFGKPDWARIPYMHQKLMG